VSVLTPSGQKLRSKLPGVETLKRRERDGTLTPLNHAEIHRLQKLMKTLTKVLLILVVCCFVAAAKGASFQVFLKIDGIEGDSTDPMHLNEIRAISFKMGVLNSATFETGYNGKPKFTDLTVFKPIDSASPQLFLAAALGTHIKNATLVVRRSGPIPFEFYKIVLSDVVISGLNDAVSATAQDSSLVEPVTLNFTRIDWTFIPQNPDGSAGQPIHHFFDLRHVTGG
jgi:type VI secretion system secreted protein Hcp